MENIIITEDTIKKILNDVLTEQSSKISSKEINRIDFKIDEFLSSLNDTIKEFKQLNESIPNSLLKVTNSKISTISGDLTSIYNNTLVLKQKLSNIKKSFYRKNVEIENKDL